jgi:hypothetical protein
VKKTIKREPQATTKKKQAGVSEGEPLQGRFTSMKLTRVLSMAVISIIAITLTVSARAEIYNISTASALITPAFRGEAGTTWFGWNEGQFFGQPVPSSTSRILNNPTTSNGTIGLTGVEFYQNDRASGNFTMIGSSVGNIYTGSGAIGKQAAATLVAPMAAGGVDGFTTIVIQGRTTTAGGFSSLESLIANYPRFSTINGISAEFLITGNAANQGQWWAQYEIPGYSSSYTIGMDFLGGTGTTPISIASLTVDTYWSATGYADVQAIPEPETWMLAGFGILAMFGTRFFQKRNPRIS